MADDKEPQESEIKSKEWTEIIAEQFSALAWIKGLKFYFSIFGILGILLSLGYGELECATIGLICLIIAYSLNVKEMKLEETKTKEINTSFLTISNSAGAWNGTIGAVLLIIAWGYFLFISLYSTLEVIIETHPDTLATLIGAIIAFTLPALIVPVPLTGLILWKKDFFFPNTNAKMHARSMIRIAYSFGYFLIFFMIFMSFYGWYAPEITLIDVILMATFFLASSFISVLPKYTPTKEDSKDAEFITFFIILTIITYTFFMMLSVMSVTDYDLTVLPIVLFCILILLILSYNFILELVKKYFLNGQNNVDDSYDFYKKEKNTGSLLYIGLISLFLFSDFTTFILSLLGSLFVISIVKTRITGLSDWKTPLGNLTKYEFSLFTFNIVIVLAFVYAIHDEIEFSRSENEPLSNSCESLKSGDGLVTSRSSYSYIENCDLSYRYLANENMAWTNIWDTSFKYATLRNADLSRAIFSGDVDFTNANLDGADLSRADISGNVHFTNANLDGADLSRADISGNVDFTNATLDGADLTDAYLYNADLTDANLRNVTFNGAYLENVNFQGADLRGADFTNAIFTYAVFDENTIVDKDALAGITLDNSDLSHFNLSGYDLTGTSLKGIDLSGRDFSGYNFTGTNFNGANLSGTNLSGSTLTGISGFDLQGCPSSMPDNWICLTNNLIGPETAFRGIDFSNGNLSNIDLSNSNFSSANLKNTYFSNTNLTNSYFSYGNFDEINDMIMWYEDDPENVTDYFEYIDFEGDFDDYLVKIKTESAADLSNANLSGANLSNANLSGANLSYVDFAYANLINADLSDADLTGTIWRYTICPDGTNTEESGSCESN